MTAVPKLPSATPVPVPRRHHALAAIEVAVAEAGRVRDGYARRIETLKAQGQCSRRLGVLLRLVEARLEQLYRSRHVLLHGDEGDNG